MPKDMGIGKTISQKDCGESVPNVGADLKLHITTALTAEQKWTR